MCWGVPGGVAAEVASGCWGLSDRRGVAEGSSAALLGVVAGEMVEGSSTLPPRYADFLWRVNPWNARSLNQGTQGH